MAVDTDGNDFDSSGLGGLRVRDHGYFTESFGGVKTTVFAVFVCELGR
jgi:hypothetical protein